MKQAWNLEPDNRLAFSEVLKRLEQLRLMVQAEILCKTLQMGLTHSSKIITGSCSAGLKIGAHDLSSIRRRAA
ncbi:hypothetical protein JTE90_000441 [Oedothorax gibbosus]|uniref:Uncharacterized protein n=1 Tax=Oedothorax gibbosus TaxID=931172 RepID=A0AAV6UFQ5_9ARAC|nr:hypothetical protein JTE90_000441 [Oedothorax gibbosus]